MQVLFIYHHALFSLIKKQIEQRIKTVEEQSRKDVNEIQALTAGLSAYKAQPPTPPMTPLNPEYVLHAFDEYITENIRGQIQTTVNELLQRVQVALGDTQTQIFTTVWNKLSSTRDTITAIDEAFMGRQQQTLDP
jgi:hypothetical protein